MTLLKYVPMDVAKKPPGGSDKKQPQEDLDAEGSAIPTGKFANTPGNVEELRALVTEETKYLDRLSRRIEALIESQERLAQGIDLYVRALRIFPSLGRGMAIGFGLVIGSTVIVGLFAYLLTRAEAIPIVGDFVKRIIEYINIEHLSN